jgi:hypothetical protein
VLEDGVKARVQHREDIKAVVRAVAMETWLQTASPEDIVAYCDRMRIFGENKTLQWLYNRYSGQ